MFEPWTNELYCSDACAAAPAVPAPEIVQTHDTGRYGVWVPADSYPTTSQWRNVGMFPNTPEGERDANALLAELIAKTDRETS